MNEPVLRSLEAAIRSTALHRYVIDQSLWLWPLLESLHFIGLSLLIGTVGMFDLRLLGVARRVPIIALHRLIPVGVMGFLLNASTGALFISGFPDQYIFNAAFRVKAALILIAGINVLFFYGRVFTRLANLGPEDRVPIAARIAALVSLAAWIGVMSAGRLITFFRPVA